MEIISDSKINEVKIISINKYSDERGFLSEIFKSSELKRFGFDFEIKQINHSFSKVKWTLRGLHYQAKPKEQTKVVGCLSGAIFDVAVDIRKNSPTFGKFVSFLLTGENIEPNVQNELFKIEADNKLAPYHFVVIPKGFAHGLLTLMDNSSVLYFLDNEFSQENDRSISWCDEMIKINWPGERTSFILSAKDRNAPQLSELLQNNAI
ncbi:MAG: dTDP-4-dehydrorhamnose 3,5-epimerase family protein [Candidatus Kapaibacteriales bacterium]